MTLWFRMAALIWIAGMSLQAQWVYGISYTAPNVAGTKYLGLAQTAVDYVAWLNYSPQVSATFSSFQSISGGLEQQTILSQQASAANEADPAFYYATVLFETPFVTNSVFRVEANHSVRATQMFVVNGQSRYWDPGGLSQFAPSTGLGGLSLPVSPTETLIFVVNFDINLGNTMATFLGLAPLLCEVTPVEVEQGEADRLRVLGYAFDDLDGLPAQLSAAAGIGFSNPSANDAFNELEADYSVALTAPVGAQSLVATTRYGTSPPLQIRVAAPRGIQLSVTSGGRAVDGRQCAFISEEPAMPDLTANLLNVPVGGSVSWYARIEWTYRNGGGFATHAPEVRRVLPAGEAWNLTAELGNLIHGGTAKVSATTDQGIFETNVCIRGTNPLRDTILTYISAMSPAPRWYFPRHIYVESGFRHFSPGGLPTLGAPSGYGLSQVDPIKSTQDLWNWKTNLTTGQERAETFRVAASNYWQQALDRWTDSRNRTGLNLPSLPSRSEGTCTFAQAPNATQHSFADALAIQAYNSGTVWFNNPNSTVPYVAYQIQGNPTLQSTYRWNVSNWTNATLGTQKLKNCYVKKHCYVGYPSSSPPASLTIFQTDPAFANPGPACDARGNQ